MDDPIAERSFDQERITSFQDCQGGGSVRGVWIHVRIGRYEFLPHLDLGLGQITISAIIEDLKGLVLKVLGHDPCIEIGVGQIPFDVIDSHGQDTVGFVSQGLVVPAKIGFVASCDQESTPLFHKLLEEGHLIFVEFWDVGEDDDFVASQCFFF